MADRPNVRLTLSSNPRNVLVVRHVLGGLAELIGLDAVESNDLYTAVTEACNNVVVHAYRGREGPMQVELAGLPGALSIVVRDRGRGPLQGQDRSGIGLHLVRAIADQVQIESRAGGGTELRMRFPTPRSARLGAPLSNLRAHSELPDWPAPDRLEIGLTPAGVTRTVLPLVMAGLAANVSFSSASLPDVESLGSWLSSTAGGDHLTASIVTSLRSLELGLEPFPAQALHGPGLRAAAGQLALELIEPTTAERPLHSSPPAGAIAVRITQPSG